MYTPTPKESSRSLSRQALGSVSLLLVVAMALSASMGVGRPVLADAGRDGVPERAAAFTHQATARPARRENCEKPPANQARVAAGTARTTRHEVALTSDPRRTVRPLLESLLDLPPPGV